MARESAIVKKNCSIFFLIHSNIKKKKKTPPPCIATKTKPKTHRFWWRVWRDPDPQGPIIGPPPQWECGGLRQCSSRSAWNGVLIFFCPITIRDHVGRPLSHREGSPEAVLNCSDDMGAVIGLQPVEL